MLRRLGTLLAFYGVCLVSYAESADRRISLPQNDTSETLLPLKACRIAALLNARINFVYSNCQNASTSTTYRIEQELHRCMAGLPVHAVSIKRNQTEPSRNGSSLSLFVLPEFAEVALMRLQELGAWLNSKQRHKHMHKYIFIWRAAQMAHLAQLFQLIWSKHILQAIAVTDSRRVYTFEPFTANGFTVKLCAERAENAESAFFYDKLRNLHHFKLKISMFNDPKRAKARPKPAVGYTLIDGHVAESVVGLLNANASYIEPADKQNYGSCRNGSFTGALKYIVAGATHVGFNSRFNLECMLPHMEEMYPYRRRYLFLVVPAAEMRPEFLIFVNAFSPTLWAVLALTFLLVVVFLALLQRSVRRLPRFAHIRLWRWYETVDLLFKTLLGEPFVGFARISSLRECLIAWIFFSYVLTTVYFGKLESSFVSPIFEPEIDSLSQLHRIKVPIYAVNNILDAIEVSVEPKYLKQIKARARRLSLNNSAYPYALNIAKKSQKVAFILRDEIVRDFVASTYDNELGRSSFHAVKEYLRSMHRTYIVPLGSPFLDKFQTIISAFYEFGFLEHWLNLDVGRRLKYQKENQHVPDELDTDDTDFDSAELSNEANAHKARHKAVVLNLEILQGAFYVWLLGILFSLIGFGLEYLHWCWKNGFIMLI